jgi:DNA repair exonuclease SbcCD nuclease subunit
MRIAFISDIHLGFGRKTEREKDAFIQAEEAFKKAVQEKVDLIVIPGDIFDNSVPSPEVLFEAVQLLSIPKKAVKSEIKLFKNGIELSFQGIPVIAIHGTHDFRSKDYKNVLSILDKAELLFYLKHENIVVEKGLEKASIFCFSGIPEKKALDVLKIVNPKPVKGMKNIFVFHQSIKEFLPTDDPMSVSISLEHLPKGFDYWVNGHLHWHNVLKTHNATLILVGSTVTTQLKKLEAEQGKGFIILNPFTDEISFFQLKNQRKLFYHKLVFEKASIQEVYDLVKKTVMECIKKNDSSLAPLIRLKLSGTLQEGITSSNIDIQEILKEFNGKAIFSIEKDFSRDSLKKKINELRAKFKDKASISTIGLELLEKNLSSTGLKKDFDFRRIFYLLEQGEIDKVIELFSTKEIKEKSLKQNSTISLSDFS